MTMIAENKIEKSFMFVSYVVNIFMNPAFGISIELRCPPG